MTNEFEKWYSDNLIWLPDNSSMMFDVWESILQFTSNNRVCNNCKYYFKDKFGATCSNESINIVNAYGSTEPDVYLKVSADFSCNKFEPKE